MNYRVQPFLIRKANAFLLGLMVLIFQNAAAQDTFSICAVDAATGQVGSAGATCITSAATSAIIISDVHPGTGVIHTQAYWVVANQNYARSLMYLGTLSPQMIIDSLVAHDSQGNNTIRQYGVVDLTGGGRSAAYTGVNCNSYKNHIAGADYAIQGNILLGQNVLDSMQFRFLNTQGTLACRLMAALQGAKMPGADVRCAPYGLSSFSAFIRVANPTDSVSSLFLDISVNTYPSSVDPIDSLQTLFDAWGGCTVLSVPLLQGREGIRVFPNPASNAVSIETAGFSGIVELVTVFGNIVTSVTARNQDKVLIDLTDLPQGVYVLKLKDEKSSFSSRIVKQ